MVRCWLLSEVEKESDRQLPLHLDPAQYVDLDTLFQNSGVLYWKIDLDRIEEDGIYNKIRAERGYTYEDTIEISRQTLPDFDNKIRNFFIEHFHADEEIRFVLAGSGYFDIRDRADQWLRILVEAGDLIVLPAGIHHRFTLDTTNYVKVKRLFVGEPVWMAINRPNEDHAARKQYKQQLETGFVA